MIFKRSVLLFRWWSYKFWTEQPDGLTNINKNDKREENQNWPIFPFNILQKFVFNAW